MMMMMIVVAVVLCAAGSFLFLAAWGGAATGVPESFSYSYCDFFSLPHNSPTEIYFPLYGGLPLVLCIIPLLSHRARRVWFYIMSWIYPVLNSEKGPGQ